MTTTPDIRQWIDGKFEDMNCYVTQMLSDHRSFRKYLRRMGKTDSPYCVYEKGKAIADAMHTDFKCAHWQS